MTDPADEPGLCLSTLNDSLATYEFQGTGMAVSADGQYVYLSGVNDPYISRIDTATWTANDTWADAGGYTDGLATDAAGDLYVLIDDTTGTVTKITPAGTVTLGFATLPANWDWEVGLTAGADGLLYAAASENSVYDSAHSVVVSIDPSTGTVTDVAALHGAAYGRYGWATATSDGTVYAQDKTASGTVTIVRKASGGTVTDVNVQDVVYPYQDFTTNNDYGLFVDNTDQLVVVMTTFQNLQHAYPDSPNDPYVSSALYPDNPGGWSHLVNATLDAGYTEPSILRIDPDPGATDISARWSTTVSEHATAGVTATPTLVSGTFTISIVDDSTGTVLATSSPSASSCSVSWDSDTPPLLAIGVRLDVTGLAGTETSLRFDLDVSLKYPAPDLSWFLHVAADGTVTRVAGTWDYFGSPGPTLTYTDYVGNIGDGPLGSSVASLAGGAGNVIGQNPDRSVLYFSDNSPEVLSLGLAGTLLRKLAICPAVSGMGFVLGMVTFN